MTRTFHDRIDLRHALRSTTVEYTAVEYQISNKNHVPTVNRSFTPWSHLIRLGVVLVLALIAFIAAVQVIRPDSWNSVAWYRGDALADMATLPMTYGGNESCYPCHEEVDLGPGHLNLSCESCHGPVVDHIQNELKIGDAIVVQDSAWQCLNCHGERINRPEGFAQYRYGHGDKKVRRQKSERGSRFCLDCHKAHAPELYGPLWM